MLTRDAMNETTTGAVASVAMPSDSMIKGPKRNIYSKTKVSKKKTRSKKKS